MSDETGNPGQGQDAGLTLRGVSKAFGATRALAGVDIAFAPGTIHALIGENGAGKSTLLKIVCGVHGADTGQMRLHGRPYAPASPAEASRAGVALVPQELRVVPAMTAAENVFLPDWPMRRILGLIPAVDRDAMRAGFRAILARLDLALDPDCPAQEMSFAERQVLVIARALRRSARVMILDEPTAALERAEATRLFALLARLRAAGTAVVFVSHRLEEVEEIADTVTVLRDGAVVARHARGAYAVPDLIRAMTGRDLDARAAPHWREPGAERLAAEVALRADPVPVVLQAGRAEGLAGLLGAGGEAVLSRLFGAGPPQTARIDGRETLIDSPARAIAAGIGHVPGERRLGILPRLSVAENIALPHLGTPRRPDRATVRSLIGLLDIRPADPDAPAGGLSGGNQQKVIFARWLAASPAVLLLDEPTHGVDIGAKAAIHRLIHDFVAKGGAALIHSAEFHELLGLCDRVTALRHGTAAASLARGEPGYTEQDLRTILGG